MVTVVMLPVACVYLTKQLWVRQLIISWSVIRYAYRLLVGKPEGRRPLGRQKRRWLDNIRMDLVEVDGVMWSGLIWLRIGRGGELL
jgi:hypothetical protein